MWLCTQEGFFSIVQKLPGEFHVRARVKRDLENLRALVAKIPRNEKERRGWPEFGRWEIHRSDNADYRWRMVVGQPDVIMMMAALADSIDYPNFKSRIHDRPDQSAKSRAYATLWSNLVTLQNSPRIPAAFR